MDERTMTAGERKHFRGIPAWDAKLPRKRHKCWGWSYGPDETNRHFVYHCRCGAVQFDRDGVWHGKNSRRSPAFLKAESNG